MHEYTTLRAPLYCPQGSAEDLYELMSELDEYNAVTFQELLDVIPGYQGNIETGLRLLSWRARKLMGANKDQPKLTLLTQVDLTSYTANNLLSVSVSAIEACILVSSQREDGQHLPLLDLDYPAGLYRDKDGQSWLNIYPASPAIDYHGLEAVEWADEAMAAIGLERVAGRPQSPLWSVEAYGIIANALGNTWAGCFEDLWQVTGSLETAQKAAPKDEGFWYKVDGEALLVPSTSWYHLYIDRPIEQKSYIRAVDVMAGCGLLNPGFANGARDRGFTSLRRPGLKKLPPPEPMGEDDIPF